MNGSVSSGGSTASPSSSSTTDETATSLDSDSSSSTGAPEPGCSNGIVEAGEWCYERVEVDLSGFVKGGGEEILRLFSGPDGIAVWANNGFTQLALDGEQPVVGGERFFTSVGWYEPLSVVLPAKLSTDGSGRPDFVHWGMDRVNPDYPLNACGSHFIVAGISRPPSTIPGGGDPSGRILDMECDRDSMVVPIDLNGEGIDEFFAVDINGGLAAVYADAGTPQHGRPEGMEVVLVQEIDGADGCTIASARQGDIDGNGWEDAVVLVEGCQSNDGWSLLVFNGDGTGTLQPEPENLPVPDDVFTTLEVDDIDGNGFADLVLAGPNGAYLLNESGMSTLDLKPVLVQAPYREVEPQEVLYLPVTFAQFDGTPAREIAMTVAGGLSVVSSEGVVLGSFDEPVASFATFDLNEDGLADVAVFDGDSVVAYLSDP